MFFFFVYESLVRVFVQRKGLNRLHEVQKTMLRFETRAKRFAVGASQ